MLWELLTLRRLFLRDTDVNTMYAVLSSEIKPPSEHRSDVPPELDEIVLKALCRNPDERWQTAREMGKALRRVLSQQEELVGPPELADWMPASFERTGDVLIRIDGSMAVPSLPRGGTVVYGTICPPLSPPSR